MSNNNILSIDDLKQATGYERHGDVEKCLRDNDIRFFRSKKGVWTTLALVNAAGGIMVGQQPDNQSIL